MSRIGGIKEGPGVWRLAPRKFLLEANVRGLGRTRLTFEGTLYEARAKLSELKKALREAPKGNCSLKKFEKMRDVLEYYRENHYQFTPRFKTCRSIYQTLLAELGELEIKGISKDGFNAWVRTKETAGPTPSRTLRPGTLNNFIKITKAAFNFCQERELVDTNPVAKVELRAEMNIQRRIASYDEFMALYRALPSYLQPWLEFIYKIPTRREEVLSLRNPEDISLSKQELYLPDENSKTGKGRVFSIPLSMIEYFRTIPPESRRVFYRPEQTSQGMVYHPLNGRGVYQTLRRAAKRLGMKGINVHLFRRTAAVNMLRSGVDIKTVQVAGGWSSLDILVERYLPLGTEDVKKAVEKVDIPIERLRLSA